MNKPYLKVQKTISSFTELTFSYKYDSFRKMFNTTCGLKYKKMMKPQIRYRKFSPKRSKGISFCHQAININFDSLF